MDSHATKEQSQRPTFTHVCHHHPLELTNGPNNHSLSCYGCALPIAGGRKDYYTCRSCSFSLHSSCFKMPPSLRHPSHPAHELCLSSATAALCRACANPIAPVGGGGSFSYGCSLCHVHFHSVCLFRPVSVSHSFHQLHELSLKFSSPYGAGVGFSCDVCGKPGLPDQWLYRCDQCNFDIHPECSAVSAVTTTRSALTAGSPSGAPPQPPPAPAGYPPLLPPTAHGLPNQGPPTVQLQQPLLPPGTGVGMNYAQPQVAGFGYQQPAAFGTGMTQPQLQVIGNGYPNPVAYSNMQTISAGPGTPGMRMGMGTMVMAGVTTGVGEGIGQGIVQSTMSGFGFGNDSSGCSDQ